MWEERKEEEEEEKGSEEAKERRGEWIGEGNKRREKKEREA